MVANETGSISDDLRGLAVPCADLCHDPANARKHSDRNIASIAASLRRFGQRKPIVVQREGMVVRAGNGTLEAARSLGWTDIAAIVVDDDNVTAAAYAIADNRTADLAEWDDDVLASVLGGLREEGWDLDRDLGFDDDDLDRLLDAGPVPQVDEDEPPDPPDDPVTQPGDVWEMGDHLLICGDSTSADVVAKVMGTETADLCVTDPPYNVNYGTFKGPKFRERPIENDNLSQEDFRTFCRAFVAQIKSNVSGCVYVFGAPGPDGRIMFTALDDALHCSTTIVWNKDVFTLGRGKYQNKYEPCWFGWVGSGSRFVDDRTLSNVWDFPRPKASKEHPTMKPVAVIAQAISHASKPGDLIFEPFAGSGTTVVAAEQLGRRVRAIELAPAYCDVVVRRWEGATGRAAVRRPCGDV